MGTSLLAGCHNGKPNSTRESMFVDAISSSEMEVIKEVSMFIRRKATGPDERSSPIFKDGTEMR